MSQWPTGRRASACIYLEWRVCNFVSNNFVPGNFNIVSMIQVFCSQCYFLNSRKFCSFLKVSVTKETFTIRSKKKPKETDVSCRQQIVARQ